MRPAGTIFIDARSLPTSDSVIASRFSITICRSGLRLVSMLQVAVEILVRPNRQQNPLGLVPQIGEQKLLINAVELVNKDAAQVSLFFLPKARISHDGTNGLMDCIALVGRKLLLGCDNPSLYSLGTGSSDPQALCLPPSPAPRAPSP